MTSNPEEVGGEENYRNSDRAEPEGERGGELHGCTSLKS